MDTAKDSNVYFAAKGAVARLTFLTILPFAPITLAGISAPNSSVTLSADGKSLLVMVSPWPRWDNGNSAVLPSGKTASIRVTFKSSGLYDATTLKPRWQVRWYSLAWDLICSDDMRYVARINRQGMRTFWAIAFYADGKLLRTYSCDFLLQSLKSEFLLPYSTWDWHTQWYKTIALSVDHRHLELSTAKRRLFPVDNGISLGRQEFYTFDMATSAMVASHVVGAWVIWAYGFAGMLLLTLSTFGTRFLCRVLSRKTMGRGFEISSKALTE